MRSTCRFIVSSLLFLFAGKQPAERRAYPYADGGISANELISLKHKRHHSGGEQHRDKAHAGHRNYIEELAYRGDGN